MKYSHNEGQSLFGESVCPSKLSVEEKCFYNGDVVQEATEIVEELLLTEVDIAWDRGVAKGRA